MKNFLGSIVECSYFDGFCCGKKKD